jgi:hypothetical protein
MIQDLVFVCGCLVLLYGLIQTNSVLVFLSLGIAAFSRQTTLLLIPTTLVWLWCSGAWSRRSAACRLLLSVASVALVVAIYAWSASVASSFSLPSRNAELLVGLVHSVVRGSSSLPGLAEFALRLFVPFCVPLGIMLGFGLKPLSRSRWIDVLLPLSAVAAIAAQPLLAGPTITGANATRLTALGLPFAIFAIGSAVGGASAKDPQPMAIAARWGLILIFAGIFLSTWHHMLTIVGPAGKTQTFIEQVVASAVVFAGGRLGRPWGRP